MDRLGENMFDVRASLRSDMNEGWVWVSSQELSPRSIIKIDNLDKNCSVYCEALYIDKNFLSEYNKEPRIRIIENKPTIVINDWYRAKLGNIETKSQFNLKIVPSNGVYGKFMSCIQHPQIIVRLATYLSLTSIILGLIGIGLSLKH